MGILSYVFFGLIALAFMATLVIVVAIWRGTSPDVMFFGNKGNKSWDSLHKITKEMNERQKQLAQDMAELRERTANIEKILREVE